MLESPVGWRLDARDNGELSQLLHLSSIIIVYSHLCEYCDSQVAVTIISRYGLTTPVPSLTIGGW